ncbi:MULTISPECIES: hypothetical protein [unclassified Bradyrhizobium]
MSSRSIPTAFDSSFGDDFRAQSFSDWIVISDRASDPGLERLLFAVTQLALDLLANGILSRGSIARGKLHHTDKVVLGPALVAAYQIESTIAVYSRIIVDQQTHIDFEYICAESVECSPKGLEGQLRFDEDGPIFVDIFAPSVAWLILQCRASRPRVWKIAASCRSTIQAQLNDSIYQPDIYKKLRWLTVYWNYSRRQTPPDQQVGSIEFPTATIS